jgi:hypothetical protein
VFRCILYSCSILGGASAGRSWRAWFHLLLRSQSFRAKKANRNVGSGGDRSRGRFATPAEFPRDDCSPDSLVHRKILGFVHRSRPFSVAHAKPNVRFATFGPPVGCHQPTVRKLHLLTMHPTCRLAFHSLTHLPSAVARKYVERESCEARSVGVICCVSAPRLHGRWHEPPRARGSLGSHLHVGEKQARTHVRAPIHTAVPGTEWSLVD